MSKQDAENRAATTRSRLRVPSDAVLVAGLFVVAVAVYLVVVRSRVGPFVDNDEYIYGNLAQSIAAGDGATWRGVDPGLRTLYPYVIAPAWAVADGTTAYRLTQAIGVVLVCSVVWPVWLAARELSPRRWALVAPVLALLGVWMVESGRVMTEALAVPAATWSLCLTVVALRRDRRGWLVAAIGFAILAGLARSQAGAVLVAVTLAVTLDVLRRPAAERAASVRAKRLELGVLWGMVIVGTVLAAGPLRSKLGSYGEVVGKSSPVGQIGRFAADHVIDVALVAGIVPWLVVLGLAFGRKAWRDEVTGPFLAVFIATSVVFVVVAGWFGATVSARVIERYVEYAGPVVLVGIVPAVRQVTWRGLLGAGVLTAVFGLALAKDASKGHVAPALHAVGEALGWPSAPGSGAAWPVAVAILGITALISLVLWVRDREATVDGRWGRFPASLVVLCSLILASGAGLLLTSAWAWRDEARQSTRIRDAFGRTPDGIDTRIHGAGTIVVDGLPPAVPLWIEFFNKKIDRVAANGPASEALGAGYGPSCRFQPTRSGRFTSGDCAPGKRSFLFMTADGSVATLRGGGPARDVGVPAVTVVDGPPQLLALRTPVCNDTTGGCGPAPVTTFTRRPGKLTLKFSAPQEAHQVLVGGRPFAIEPGVPATVTVPVPAGRHETIVQGDWPALLLGVPELESTTLKEDGRPAVRLN